MSDLAPSYTECESGIQSQTLMLFCLKSNYCSFSLDPGGYNKGRILQVSIIFNDIFKEHEPRIKRLPIQRQLSTSVTFVSDFSASKNYMQQLKGVQRTQILHTERLSQHLYRR